MKGNGFIFHHVQLLYYKCQVNPNHDGSYIDSTGWIKNKKSTANLINKKDTLFSIRCSSCVKS